MSKKRRIFDIEVPQIDTDPVPPRAETFPAEKVSPDRIRRGPMATAINEAATSTQERAVIEAQIRAENDALAHEHVRLKNLGLIVSLVRLDAVATTKLVRDRIKGPDFELGELKSSIAELGLSNPIRIEERADGRYELIQGYRRLAAYKQLLADTGDAEKWGTIPAVVSQPGDTIEDLYRKMVDENLVRKDISFAEMAQLALDYAADPATKESDPDKAVAILFKSANYSKRSYVRSFIKLMERVGELLDFPAAIPRALGLSLAARLEEDPHLVSAIKAELKGWENRSEQDELGVLRKFVKAEDPAAQSDPARIKAPPKKSAAAKTSFQFQSGGGRAKCTAAAGRLEIRLDRDFSTVDRRKLEAAVQLMLDQLD